jgi:hypothetical protein
MRQILESGAFGYSLPPGTSFMPFSNMAVPQQHYFPENDLSQIAQQQRNLDIAVSQHGAAYVVVCV